MFNSQHQQDQDHTRDDTLGNEIQDFNNDEAWTDRTALKEDHRLNDHELAFLDYLVYLQREWQIIHLGKTYQITHGTRWLSNKLSPVTIERLEAWDLIKRPGIDEGNGTVERYQLMRRSIWDLGEKAHEYLADGYLRGAGVGDRNERMAHSLGTASVHTTYNNHSDHPELTAHAYQQLEKDGPVYDVVIVDNDSDDIAAVVEVETRVGDKHYLARDAQKIAEAPGNSWWLFPTRKSANRALSNIQRKGIIGERGGKKRWPDTLATKLMTERLNEELSKGNYHTGGQSPPVTEVATYDQMRRMIDEHAPWALHDYVGTETDTGDTK